MFESKEDKLKDIKLEMGKIKRELVEAKKFLADRREMGDTSGVSKYEVRVQSLIRKHGELNSDKIKLEKELGVETKKDDEYSED